MTTLTTSVESPLARPTPARPPAVLSPLLLYPFLAALVMWPFAPRAMRHAGDMHAVVAAVVEARNALAEGQFPIRVAPRQLDGTRYPLFQFYGNFPYTAAGLLHRIPGIDPYAAWKIVMFAALLGGAAFTHRTAVLLIGRRRGNNAAVAAGAAFAAAPYMLTDLYGRGAFAEAVALGLLPALLFCALRLLLAPRWRNVPAAAVVWALVGLSHNITYLYASALLGVVVLIVVPPWTWQRRSRSRRRVACVAAAAALQAALLAWYFVPQWRTLDQLNITAATALKSPATSSGRVPLGVLLAPKMTPLPAAPLGMQAGWPVLGGAGLAAAGVAFRWWRRRRIAPLVRTAAILSAVVCGVACFMAWSPFDFWRWLPRVFRFVQFPYRLLAFAVTAGALAIACAVVMWMPPRGRAVGAVVLLASIGLTASSYSPPAIPLDPHAVPRTVENPVAGGLNDYLVATTDVATRPTPSFAPASPPRFAITTDEAATVRLPVLYYTGLLKVLIDDRPVDHRPAGRYVAVELSPGRHQVEVRFVGTPWANWLSLAAWLCVPVALGVAILNSGRRRRRRRARRFNVASVALTLAGAAALFLGWRAPQVSAAVARLIHPPVTVTASASRPSVPQRTVDLAFDDDPLTEWHAAGSAPIFITLVPSRPAVPRRIELDVRAGEQLYEGWHRVRVDLFRGGKPVGSQAFDLPRAADERVAAVVPPAAVVDRLELHFDVPVTKLRDGSRHVDAGAVNPGYREIRIDWEKSAAAR